MARLAAAALLTCLLASCLSRADEPKPGGKVRPSILELRTRSIVKAEDLSGVGAEREVGSLAFSPDGQLIAWGRRGYFPSIPRRANGLSIYHVATGKLQGKIHTGQCMPESIAFSADGKRIATAGMNERAIQLWDIETGREFQALAWSPVLNDLVAISPDGTKLAQVGHGHVSLWAIDPPRQLWVRLLGFSPTGIAFTPDGKTLVGGSSYRGHSTIVVIAAESGKLKSETVFVESTLRWALSSDGKHVATSDGNLRRLSSVHKVERKLYEGGFIAAVFSPDSKMLVTSDVDGNVAMLEVTTGLVRGGFKPFKHWVRLAFSPTGRHFATGDDEGFATIVDLYPTDTPKLSAEQHEALWSDLAGPDAPRAYSALRLLTAANATAFIKDRFTQTDVLRTRLTTFLPELDDRRFAVRDAATKKLTKLGKLAEPDLRQALATTQATETRRRIESILAEWDRRPLDGEILAVLRAIEALEAIGTPEAEDVLRQMVNGKTFEMIEREAKASLSRLAMKALRNR